MKTLLALFLLIPSLSWALDKDELKEELKYWKSLLDDELITQKDYDKKKKELIKQSSSTKKNSVKKINNTDEVPESTTLNKFENKYDFNGYKLNSFQVEEIQKVLKELGYTELNFSVDGILGNQTKHAINKWLDCKDFDELNEFSHASLIFDKYKGCLYSSKIAEVSESNNYKKNNTENNEKLDYVFCAPKSSLDGLYDESTNALIPRIGKCTKFELKVEPQWCNWSKANQPKRKILMDACETNTQIVKSNQPQNKNDTKENNINKSSSSIYDATIIRPYTKIYKYHCQGTACEEKDVLLTPEKGDELKILWWQINAYCKDTIKIYHKESKTIGFIKENSMNIINKSKFFDMSKVITGEKHYNGLSKCIISTYNAEGDNLDSIYSTNNTNNAINSNNTTYETSSNTAQTTNSNSNYENKISDEDTKKLSCVGLDSKDNFLYKLATGYISKKQACEKINTYSDSRLCYKLKREERSKEDINFGPMVSRYKEAARKRGIVCIDGDAYDSSDSNTQSIASQKKLEKKLEKKMQCTVRKTEWLSLCGTGDYRSVNGKSCYGYWYDSIDC